MTEDTKPSNTINAQTWSDRFEEKLHPMIVGFNASIGFDIELLEYDLTGSIAHARMLAHTGIITVAEAEKMVEGLEQIRGEFHNGEFQPTIDQEDVPFCGRASADGINWRDWQETAYRPISQ